MKQYEVYTPLGLAFIEAERRGQITIRAATIFALGRTRMRGSVSFRCENGRWNADRNPYEKFYRLWTGARLARDGRFLSDEIGDRVASLLQPIVTAWAAKHSNSLEIAEHEHNRSFRRMAVAELIGAAKSFKIHKLGDEEECPEAFEWSLGFDELVEDNPDAVPAVEVLKSALGNVRSAMQNLANRLAA